MNVAMLLSRLDTEGSEAFKIDRNRYCATWEALTKAREDYYESTGKILLKDLKKSLQCHIFYCIMISKWSRISLKLHPNGELLKN
jgi:hypothetical protein